MKTAMGSNAKVIVPRDVRDRVRALFEAIGVEERHAPMDELDVFVLHDGANIGFYYVDPAEALDEAQLGNSVWLEIRVSDVPRAERALDDLAIARVDYHDRAHAYFRAPGGLVFRLAGLA